RPARGWAPPARARLCRGTGPSARLRRVRPEACHPLHIEFRVEQLGRANVFPAVVGSARPRPRGMRGPTRPADYRWKYGSSTLTSVIRSTGSLLRVATRRIASGLGGWVVQNVLLLSLVTLYRIHVQMSVV